MTLAEFKASVKDQKPPERLAPALAALWWAARGDWDKAHTLVMDEGGEDCAWVHAYLHRLEGDASNAGYWYGQAGKPAAKGPLEGEWDATAADILARCDKR